MKSGNIEIENNFTLSGDARVYKKQRFGPSVFKLPGANFPSQDLIDIYEVANFDDGTEESIYFSSPVPHDWDETTNMTFIVLWTSENAVNNGGVRWKLVYNSKAGEENLTTGSTTISQSDTITGATDQNETQKCIFSTELLSTNMNHNECMGFKLSRDVTHGDDTLSNDAALTCIVIKYRSNKLGNSS